MGQLRPASADAGVRFCLRRTWENRGPWLRQRKVLVGSMAGESPLPVAAGSGAGEGKRSRRLAPGAAGIHSLRSGEPACRGQRSGPRSGLHGAADGAVLAAPHQPRQPVSVCPPQRTLHLVMSATGINKLPFGNFPRLLLAWVCTEAVRTQSRELVLGRSLTQFMRTLGIGSDSGGSRGGTDTAPQPDEAALQRCTVSLNYEDEQGEASINSSVADRTEFWWNPKRKPNEPTSLWESKI